MKLRKNLIRTISAFSLSVICFFLFLFFLYEKDNKYTDSCLQPISGILCPDEESLEKDIFYLTNQWQFYPDASLTPRDFKQGLPDMPMEFITIGKYNDFSLGDRDRSPYGRATYRMSVELPQKSGVYSLYLPEIFSSYRLYVNGTLLTSMGNPDSKDRKTGIQSVSFSARGSVEILIQAANFSHYYSGMTYPPIFGLEKNIWRYQYTRLFLHNVVIILVFLLCLFSAYFFLKLRDKRAGTFLSDGSVGDRLHFLPGLSIHFSARAILCGTGWSCSLHMPYIFLYVYLQNTFLNCQARGYSDFLCVSAAVSAQQPFYTAHLEAHCLPYMLLSPML